MRTDRTDQPTFREEASRVALDSFSFVSQRVFRDGIRAYELLHGALHRATRATTLGMTGAAVGAIVGALMPRRKPDFRSEAERAHDEVTRFSVIRSFLPHIEACLAQLEHAARQRMGQEPRGPFGSRPTSAPQGTYWSVDYQSYIQPDDERWSEVGYEESTGQPWEPSEEEDEKPH
jgi:hypothetical protein